MKGLKSLMFALLCFLFIQCASEAKVDNQEVYNYYYFSQKDSDRTRAFLGKNSSIENQLDFRHTYVNGIEYTYVNFTFDKNTTYLQVFTDSKLVLKVLKSQKVELTEKPWE